MLLPDLDPDLSAVRHLLALSDEFTLSLYPTEDIHLESPQALKDPDVCFVGIQEGDDVVACGAVRVQRDDGMYGEIKRVFVLPEHRGKGYSKRIVQHLELHLQQAGVGLVRLVTGTRQTEALALYRRLGYRERGAYGAYEPGPFAVFMEKRIDA